MNEKFKGLIFVFFGACSFGVLSTIVKLAYGEGYTIGEVTGSQTMFGAIFLWLGYLMQQIIRTRNKPTNNTKQTNRIDGNRKIPIWKIMLAGSCTGLVGIFYYQAVQYIPVSIGIILLMQYLWISLLLEYILFKKKASSQQWIAAIFVLVGTLLAGGIFNEQITLNLKGLIYGGLAAISYSLFIISSGRVGNEYSATKKSALMITGSMILTWSIFPPYFLFNGVLWGGLYTWGLALAFLGAVIPPAFFAYGIPKIGVNLAAIISAVELPVAVCSSFFILNEYISIFQWIGVTIILSGIVWGNLKQSKE